MSRRLGSRHADRLAELMVSRQDHPTATLPAIELQPLGLPRDVPPAMWRMPSVVDCRRVGSGRRVFAGQSLSVGP